MFTVVLSVLVQCISLALTTAGILIEMAKLTYVTLATGMQS